ncbi:intraflagellar transport protein 25 homolog isoform 2-T4 [Trichechus inunguis]
MKSTHRKISLMVSLGNKMHQLHWKDEENNDQRNPETFWTTTGMFPQEFIICFHKHVRIEKLVIQSYFVRTLRIEKSTSKEPVDFEQWIERDLVHTEGRLQNEEIARLEQTLSHLVSSTVENMSRAPLLASPCTPARSGLATLHCF